MNVEFEPSIQVKLRLLAFRSNGEVLNTVPFDLRADDGTLYKHKTKHMDTTSRETWEKTRS